jgi:uncharacterized protein (TIGR03067 family)
MGSSLKNPLGECGMKMRVLAVLGALIFLGSTLPAQDKKETKFDATKLVGDWKITEGFKMGEKSDAKALSATVSITKDKITLKDEMGTTYVMSYKLDEKTTPVKIEMEGVEGPVKDFKAGGIISIDGESFKLCYTMGEDKRPTEFESKKDSKNFYFVLKKAK